MIEPILMLLTGIWVLIGAVFLMPYFVNRKINKPKGTVHRIINHVKHENQSHLAGIENRLDSKLMRIEGKLLSFPKIPDNIPTMEQVNKSIDHIGEQTQDLVNNLQNQIPNIMIATVQKPEFETVIKSYEGRMYAAKGIELDKIKKLTGEYTHGMEAAEKVYLSKIQGGDPDDKTELTLILRDALQLAEQNGFIEEGSTEQKIGLVHGVLKLIDRLQKRGGSSPQNGGSLLSSAPSNLPSGGGSELDNYYG